MKDTLQTNTHYTSVGSTALKARCCTLTLIEGGRTFSEDPSNVFFQQQSTSVKRFTSEAAVSEMAPRTRAAARRASQTSQFFVNRTRALTLGFGLILITLFALGLLQTPAAALFAPPATAATQTKEIVVQPGDSLWKIAIKNPVETMTTQELINHIIQHNHLNTATLTQGQKLIIPEIRK